MEEKKHITLSKEKQMVPILYHCILDSQPVAIMMGLMPKKKLIENINKKQENAFRKPIKE